MEILGKEGLRDLGFSILIGGKVTSKEAIMLNRVGRDLPSTTDVARADDIELQVIMENAARIMDNLIMQFKGSKCLPMHELLSSGVFMFAQCWNCKEG